MTATTRPWRLVEPSALPGLGPALGFTLLYLGFFVLLPLTALALRPWELGVDHVRDVLTNPRTLAALRLSFGAAFAAACINAVFGTIVAWVLVRYDFPGRRLLDAFIDLPFALPTAVAGISLAAIYAPNGLIGTLFEPHDIRIAYTPLGVMIALIFVGFPFVVRSIQPVLEDFEAEAEEAAATLGASRLETIRKVIFPAIAPAMLAGFSLAFARAVGEYGSVIFIAGNIPMVSEIAPLLIVIRLEEFDYAGAAAVGLVMLAISFLLLLVLNAIQSHIAKRGR
ncbi:MAG TPA: sulfate ABC transporter permease subunit CysT [Vitreimonas sp.]|uniref:sulfate ABC transporter permease subunit CysT n=1 Tax=Vitreimonas sp. TaxID=3069702 RepID=UPI002D658DD8|nr:sulfate ABC transporter permease subunit CysT [Vitreimonas sp.]HYD89465.1 sulfate ABC transporter permease subunit CysT [Vitreimonas sp.]